MVYALIACRVLLAIVFAVSAFGKLRSRRAFEEFTSAARQLAPGWLIRPLQGSGATTGAHRLAAVVVGCEVAIPPLLLAPRTAAVGFALAAALLAAFTAAIVAVLRRGDRVACHCFGATDQALRPAHVVRNLLLLTAAATGLVLALAAPSAQPALVGAVAAVGTAGILALPVLLFDDLLDLFTPTIPRRPTAP